MRVPLCPAQFSGKPQAAHVRLWPGKETWHFDQAGWWKLWPEVVFDDDRNACGQAVRFFVHEAGSL